MQRLRRTLIMGTLFFPEWNYRMLLRPIGVAWFEIFKGDHRQSIGHCITKPANLRSIVSAGYIASLVQMIVPDALSF
jgi:hypothetical protein